MTSESESSLTASSATEEISAESVESVESVEAPELPPLTEEQITAQKELLERGIALGMEWFEQGKDGADFALMSEKEQSFTRLLDPIVWMMREALISYEEREAGCEECTVRVETRGNGIQLAMAEMLLGSIEEPEGDG